MNCILKFGQTGDQLCTKFHVSGSKRIVQGAYQNYVQELEIKISRYMTNVRALFKPFKIPVLFHFSEMHPGIL